MRYLLTVLTNGRRECLARALVAFAAHVRPLPEAVFVMDDGGRTGYEVVVQGLALLQGQGAFPIDYEDSPEPIGMCRAHAHCWHAAAASDLEWAFHLEDDFVVLRPLRLEELAHTLADRPHLVQMALVRTPAGAEVEHGGYIPQAPGWYVRCEASSREWIETARNWATCPALFRPELAREFPWPLEPGCEGEFGPRVVAARPEARFGLWGWGEPWAAHIGVERAAGAYGY